MPKPITPERIARNAFGGADILKVQSQHERFLRDIQPLPEDEKTDEIMNAVKYLIANKSDYWLETAHLLHMLLGDSNSKTEGLYKKKYPDMTKKDFCKEMLGMAYDTVSSYIRVITNYEKHGFSEEQIRALGFNKTKEIFKKGDKMLFSILSTQTDLNKLREAVKTQLKPKKQKLISEMLIHYWNIACEEDKEIFLRYINAGENPNLVENHS